MNPPFATPFFFYLLAAIMVIGGVLVITRKNAVHSAMALITTLLAQAALYLMLYAPFVAGVQIYLYDVFANLYVVGGVDQLSAFRSHVGG